MYDEQGRLVGEYDGAGNLIQETVWLEDLPVATLRPAGTGTPTPIAVYYVHADHLGTPRAVTRPSDDQLLWRWDNGEPFGNNAADENPAGQGNFQYHLRFPGQYYDAEIGTHYNYFRDYDPTIGRYGQSDPIGLEGGINTYRYVGNNPLSWSDPTGQVSPACISCAGHVSALRSALTKCRESYERCEARGRQSEMEYLSMFEAGNPSDAIWKCALGFFPRDLLVGLGLDCQACATSVYPRPRPK